MTQSITLELPDRFYQPIHRIAQQMHEPVETVLLRALQVSLPPLDGLPQEFVDELTRLEVLDDSELRRILLDTVPTEQQRKLEILLQERQDREPTANEQKQLADLRRQADLVMLRKARAAVLLRFRGNPIPTLDELRRLTVNNAA